MSTRNRPGHFDCLAKLHPDEPYFVLRAQDDLAADMVFRWATQASLLGCDPDKVREAKDISEAMSKWPRRKNPD